MAVTPLGAVSRGVVAGVVGTALMTAWQELSAKLQSSDSEEEGSEQQSGQQTDSDPWEDASAPAKVAKRIGEGVFHQEVSPDLIPTLTNATHWGYGTVWGLVYGISRNGGRRTVLRGGSIFGSAVWLMSYVQLVPMGLYEPPWEYEPKDLAMELSYHLVYGIGVAGAYAALDRG